MRDQLSVALAKHIGQELTLETARAIVNEACAVVDWSIDPAQFAAQPCAGYTLQCERLAEAREALQAQRMDYLHEIDSQTPYAVDWGRLAQLERSGALLIFTARQSDTGVLLGSLWLHLQNSLNTGRRMVTDDMFYVQPAQRGGMLAVRLWQYAERAVFAIGVREATLHSRLDNKAQRMARFMGFQPIATRVKKTHPGGDFAAMPTRHTHKRRSSHDSQL